MGSSNYYFHTNSMLWFGIEDTGGAEDHLTLKPTQPPFPRSRGLGEELLTLPSPRSRVRAILSDGKHRQNQSWCPCSGVWMNFMIPVSLRAISSELGYAATHHGITIP